MNRSFLDSKGEGKDSQLFLVFDTLENLAQLVRPAQLNLDDAEPIHIERGERIAQLVIQKVPIVELVEVDELDETDRGSGGFGSSGAR